MPDSRNWVWTNNRGAKAGGQGGRCATETNEWCFEMLKTGLFLQAAIEIATNWKFLLLQFWSLEIQQHGIGRAMLPRKALGKNPSFASSSYWWLLAFLKVSWPVAACLQPLSPSSRGLLPVCIRVSLSLHKRAPVTGYMAHPNLLWSYPNYKNL